MLHGRRLYPTGISPTTHRHPEDPRGSGRQRDPDDPGERLVRRTPLAPAGKGGRSVKYLAWARVRRMRALMAQPEPSRIALRSRRRSLPKAMVRIGTITARSATPRPARIVKTLMSAKVSVTNANDALRAAIAIPPPASMVPIPTFDCSAAGDDGGRSPTPGIRNYRVAPRLV